MVNSNIENPSEIIKEMNKGVDLLYRNKVLVILDREEAIKTALTIAKKDDIVLVAGKGHEKYQEIQGKKTFFDDVETINQIFKTII